MNKNRIGIGIIVVTILVFLGYSGYKNYLAPLPASPTEDSSQIEGSSSVAVISVEGRVVPAEYVRLGFGNGGIVSQIFLSEGDEVQSGDVIARLATYSRFEANVSAAKLQLVNAQQAYDSLFENLDLTRALAFKAVADGRDAVRDAEQRVNNLESPASQTDIDQANANLTLAEYKLERAEDDFEAYKNKPESNLVRAAKQSVLTQAQKEYDAALRLVNNLEGNASEIDIDQAQADLEVAEALLAKAEQEYEDLGGGPSPDALEMAEAALENARLQFAAAEEALAQQELRAPFAGILVSLDLKEGEFSPPGIPVAVVADLSEWHIETTDLAENDVALISAGQSVIITLDAFPGESLSGTVIEIGLLGEDSRGSVSYPIIISFDPSGLPIRWGMTAFVDISLE